VTGTGIANHEETEGKRMQRADCIIRGGTFPTGEGIEAVAIAGTKILAAGRASDIGGLADAATRYVDAAGCTVVPGLTDSHMHLLCLGTALEEADLRGVGSIREMTDRLRDFVASKRVPEGTWVVGRGWDQNRMADRRLPDREDLDAAFPGYPLLLVRLCAHVAVLNTKGLESLPLDELDPGSETNFRRRSDGSLSGMVVESGLMWVWRHLPDPSDDVLKRRFLAGAREASRAGLTEVHSDDVGSGEQLRRAVSALESLASSGEFPLRIRVKLHARCAKDVEEMLRGADALQWRSPLVRRGPVKILLDGSLGARTAALEAPYEDAPGERGILSIPEEELREMVARAHDAGSQVAIHVIGDRSARVAIDCIEAAMRRTPRPDPRHRLIHCQIMKSAMWERMAALGIVADIQPRFVASDWPMVTPRIGEARAADSYAWKRMAACGVRLAGGSDCPIESVSPLLGMRCAMTRTDENDVPRGGWHPEERLSSREALALYTTGGAWAGRSEREQGTLAAGMTADITVFGGNYDTHPSDACLANDVRFVVSAGRVVVDRLG
jgi:predicted amidohydrolase YtcJ